MRRARVAGWIALALLAAACNAPSSNDGARQEAPAGAPAQPSSTAPSTPSSAPPSANGSAGPTAAPADDASKAGGASATATDAAARAAEAEARAAAAAALTEAARGRAGSSAGANEGATPEKKTDGARGDKSPTSASGSAPPPPRPPPPEPKAAPGGVALPAHYEIVSHVLTPTGSYLPKRDGMPTGVVLLNARDKAKNESLCKALLGAHTATVKTEAQARRDNPTGDYLVTHWLVKASVADEQDCKELLAQYDFERAGRIKDAYALVEARGPVFLALDPTGEIVFLDLKDASPAEVFDATSKWMSLALASPQNHPSSAPRGLVANANKLFAKLAMGFSSLVGSTSEAPLVVKFNDPIAGTARQFNIYKAGVYLIGATFVL